MPKKSPKVKTVSSLNRIAAKSEENFISTAQDVLSQSNAERTTDFFFNMNIPRSVTSETTLEDLEGFVVKPSEIHSFGEEQKIAIAIQKFMDRQVRKLKWHAKNPGMETSSNVLMIMRCTIITTTMRIQRLVYLLDSKENLTPRDWSIAREIINRAFMSFRSHLTIFATNWFDAISQTLQPEEISELLGSFYEFIDAEIRVLDEMRSAIETRRMDLTVIPDGYNPVKPPVYFGGDVLSGGPWNQYWTAIEDHAHRFREAAF
jgi:hypothetical protein